MKTRPAIQPEFTGTRAHQAEWRRIRRDLRSRDRYRRRKAELDQYLWRYKDARLRGDDAAAEAAWLAYRQVRHRNGDESSWYERSDSIRLAAGLDDIDRAADELVDWSRHIDTRNTGTDSVRRTAARTFVSAGIYVLEREASVNHAKEPEIDRAVRGIAAQIENELMLHHREGFWRIGELRAWQQVARTSSQLAAALRPQAGNQPVRPARLAAGGWLADGEPAVRQEAWRRLMSATEPVSERARLAAAWVEWAVGTREPELAAEAYQHLMSLVPLVVAERPEGGPRREVLAAAQEHTEEAAYWLARTGRYREAVVALETGRAVELSRTLSRSSDRAEAATHLSTSDVTYEDLLAATGDGALVYLAAATAGGYALVVAARHDPQFMELPKLSRATVAGLLDPLLPGASTRSAPVTGTALRQAPARDAERLSQAGDSLTDGLVTLWDAGFRLLALAAGGPMVTLVPVGLLSLLPLHAAGAPNDPRDRYDWRHLGNFTALRYAPNARALNQCRVTARALAADPQPLLAVDVPDGYGVGAHGHLRYVAREAAEAVRRWTGAGAPRHGCTWDEFRAAADQHAVWHLACHGAAKPQAILDSRLYFADRVVTLRELRESLPPGRRRLAVLSACESNVTEASLPNEGLGLPSALLQVGFAGVIASAWKVDDLATAYLMTAFYQHWCGQGQGQGQEPGQGQEQEPAVALSLAQRWLRTATRSDLVAMLPDTTPDGDAGKYPYRHPRYWAAFAYTGA